MLWKNGGALYNGANATLTLEAKNNGKIVMQDNINGVSGYNVDITGDETGILYVNNGNERRILIWIIDNSNHIFYL